MARKKNRNLFHMVLHSRQPRRSSAHTHAQMCASKRFLFFVSRSSFIQSWRVSSVFIRTFDDPTTTHIVSIFTQCLYSNQNLWTMNMFYFHLFFTRNSNSMSACSFSLLFFFFIHVEIRPTTHWNPLKRRSRQSPSSIVCAFCFDARPKQWPFSAIN